MRIIELFVKAGQFFWIKTIASLTIIFKPCDEIYELREGAIKVYSLGNGSSLTSPNPKAFN